MDPPVWTRRNRIVGSCILAVPVRSWPPHRTATENQTSRDVDSSLPRSGFGDRVVAFSRLRHAGNPCDSRGCFIAFLAVAGNHPTHRSVCCHQPLGNVVMCPLPFPPHAPPLVKLTTHHSRRIASWRDFSDFVDPA